MGYYLNVLQEGCQYELDGQRLQFIQKLDKQYYFYICEYDEWSFKHIPTAVIMSFSIKELAYIKRVQEFSSNVKLRRIGKDKVFNRY
jgi:hypothetical protein